MRLIHISDVQLDAPFTFLGEAGQKHRDQIRKTFSNIVDLSMREGYDVMLIAGDLFDSNKPSQATVDEVISLLKRLSIPVCILPGNHDSYDPTSIYRKINFPKNVTLFTDSLNVKVYVNLDLAVHGKAVLSRTIKEKPLDGLRPLEDKRWNVAMAHGSLVIGKVEDPVRPIQPEDIANCGMDYVALGDWHGFAEQSQGTVKAAYSGAPEPTAFDQIHAGYAASVSLDEHGVILEQLRVGRIRSKQVEVKVTGHTEVEIFELLHDEAGPEVMLEAVLTGLLDVGVVVDPSWLEGMLTDQTYAVRVRDQSHPQLDAISEDDYAPDHVIGRYIELMKQRIDDAQDERDRAHAEQALQIGVALLQGKDVL
ncbi:MAG: hypothetical protein GTO18_06195 [Anaerolineales bacterium]|nr:hypothetical protein [Anaerolineales bacterium]